MITAKDIYDYEEEFRISGGQREYLEFLLNGTGFDPDRHQLLKMQLEDISGEQEYFFVKEVLIDNQLDRIPYGLNYNKGDIIKHLRRLK